ncbi:hypothetical protein CYMTET_3879 [Cymbomonas tetramitiformis]|uniref:Uncharacterized protein n=1 Tax=Cymbomonas tetramitiformis TaxID=36881 RepID=A0AAE0LKE7_9CHLO|nr:hypothetical protein CYMTET_3879 [Cymbomonas tetramitiformis]
MEQGVDPLTGFATLESYGRRRFCTLLYVKIPSFILLALVFLFVAYGSRLQRASSSVHGVMKNGSLKRVARRDLATREPCVTVQCASPHVKQAFVEDVRDRARAFFQKWHAASIFCQYEPENDALLILSEDDSAFYIIDPAVLPTPNSKTVIAYSQADGHPVKRHTVVFVNGTCAATLRSEASCVENELSEERRDTKNYRIFRDDRALCAQVELTKRASVKGFDDRKGSSEKAVAS